MTSKSDNNIEQFVKECFPNPIHDDFEENKDYDARKMLIGSLEDYDKLIQASPKEIRGEIAKWTGIILFMELKPSLRAYFKDADLTGKLLGLIERYNIKIGLGPYSKKKD